MFPVYHLHCLGTCLLGNDASDGERRWLVGSILLAELRDRKGKVRVRRGQERGNAEIEAYESGENAHCSAGGEEVVVASVRLYAEHDKG